MQSVLDSHFEDKIEAAEFWTAKQRQCHSIHYTISYRGSYKPELPQFFINKFIGPTSKGKIVFDPFAGRGTTGIQANLMEQIAWVNDINPMLEHIIYPLTHPPTLAQISTRLKTIPFNGPCDLIDWNDFEPFYHENTYRQLLNLRDYLDIKQKEGTWDNVDRFIEVIALSRLHGHSQGFFSAYSFPQIAVPPSRQRKINEKHAYPSPRDVPKRIIRKAKNSLRGDISLLHKWNHRNQITLEDSRQLNQKFYPDESVDLIITSPPFLAQVDYIQDNWLEFWFLRIDEEDFRTKLIQTPNLDVWRSFILDSLEEMYRVLKYNHYAVVEVGDVKYRRKRINLNVHVEELANKIGFYHEKTFINTQKFTKLSNCFNVKNNVDGVNTNRCVVLKKV